MSHQYFSNTACEFFPCHKNVPRDTFNCLFCYCPLYLHESCIGTPEYLGSSKDCSMCKRVHEGTKAWEGVTKALRRHHGWG